MSDPLDRLLSEPLLQPPADFTERVMQRIQTLPAPAPSRRRAGWLAWLALAAGALLGAAQLAGFMFGIWTAATAG
jgi:hypothetical protein